MGIGIDIRVNGTDKLREAKKEIGMLNNGLRESEQLSDITIQTSGLPNKSDTQSMSDGLRTYANEADKARQSIESLINYQRKLTNAVSPRTQQVAQEQPQRQYKIRDPHIIEPAQNIVSVSHPKGDTFYDNYDPKHEKIVKPRAELTNAVSPRTQQVAQDYYNTAASQATVMDATKKLKQIDVEGSKKGGVITPGQAAEAARLYKLIQDEQKKYEKEIERTGTKLDELFAKKKKLEQTSPLLRTEGEQKAVEQLKQQIEELTASSEKYQRTQDKSFDKTNKSATQSNQNIQGYRQQEDPAAAATMGSTIKKALGWGLAAVGGFSALSILAQSRAKYQQSVGHTTTLEGKGIIGGENAGEKLGMGQLEYMPFMEYMSNQGISSKNMQSSSRLAAAFGKAKGVDPNQVGSLFGTMYQGTGNSQLAAGALSMAVASGIKSIRMPEVLGMIARNTNASAQAMKGADASDKVGGATALALEAMKAQEMGKSYGHYAKSDEFTNVAQNGFQGAGSDPGEIMMFKALKGFDGPMSWEKKFAMEKMKEGGPQANPAAFHELVSNFHGSQEAQAAQLMAYFPKWNLTTKSAMNMLDMDKDGLLKNAATSGKDIDKVKPGGKKEEALTAKLENEFGARAGAKKQQLMARTENLEVRAGEIVNRFIAPMQEGLLNAAEKVLNSPVFQKLTQFTELMGNSSTSLDTKIDGLGDRFKTDTKGYRPLFEKISKEMGVDPDKMIALAATENAKFDPKAVSKTGQGVGLMQVNPKAHKEYTVEQLQDPETNIRAGISIYKQGLGKADGDEQKARMFYSGYYNNGGYEPGAQNYEIRYQKNLKNEKLGAFSPQFDGEVSSRITTGVDPRKIPNDATIEGTNGGRGINANKIGMSPLEAGITLQGTDKLVNAIEALTIAMGIKQRHLGAATLSISSNNQ
jgi:hypothetical protein